MIISSTSFPNLFKEHPDAVTAIVCAILVFCGWLTLNLGWLGISLLILPVAYVVGGYNSAKDGLMTLLQEKELDVDLLMIVAALGAAILGLWQREYSFIVDGAVLILIFAISGALESYAMQRTDRSIRGLMSLTPDTARKLVNDQEQMISVAQLQIGDMVLVKPGELVPTDGVVIEGYSTLNQASITGESLPVEKTVGDEVFGGTLNGNGALKLKIHQPPESSLIQRVIRLVEQAQTATPPSQQFIERFERGYAKVIVIIGLLLGTLPPLFLGWTWENTIYKTLIFLVVASPCALMAAIMPTLLSGMANGARSGILFKNGAQLENMGRVRAIAFDKTGTLTTGKLEVVQTMALNQDEAQLLKVAAAVESLSEHLIAEAIFKAAHQLQPKNAVNVQAHVGQGITGFLDGQKVIIGKASFIQDQTHQNNETLHQMSQQWERMGKTVVWVAYGEEILGIIGIADTVRPTVSKMITGLQRLGIKSISLLTGDNEQTAHSIALAIGINQVYAGLLPEDKVNVIQKLQKQYNTVAMVGDGINDAPALATASVGIAMGTTGSDVALETADIVLMSDRIEKLEDAIRLGDRAGRIIKQNIIFALSFIVLLLIANFTNQITLPLGVLGHEGSTVLVTLNGLRLLRN
ncbi:heavy metal translocating P-type ATPase [Chroococcus sp. FPU101]|uniref:heavy metal translocating P-type ATPase n=1 Tax=Chroococcus sp. FPU101 TaxID=1974212 RepID=UPI001A8C398B|nr:heavy metal translocating P-type ATPase [Chroococcus sp. FPU101]GFE70766.1 cobalt-transporting P-type ATPase (cobalt efflux pump) involved in cobalt tolerance [Chroococcus sp. FPU101]